MLHAQPSLHQLATWQTAVYGLNRSDSFLPDFCQLLFLQDELALDVLCCHLVDIQVAVQLTKSLLMSAQKA